MQNVLIVNNDVPAENVRELLALAREHERLLCPVHQFLFQDGTRAALAALAEIGPLLHVDVRMCSAGAEGGGRTVAERIAWEILPHPLALLARLQPDPAELFEWSVRHPDLGEIRALGQSGSVTASCGTR